MMAITTLGARSECDWELTITKFDDVGVDENQPTELNDVFAFLPHAGSILIDKTW